MCRVQQREDADNIFCHNGSSMHLMTSTTTNCVNCKRNLHETSWGSRAHLRNFLMYALNRVDINLNVDDLIS